MRGPGPILAIETATLQAGVALVGPDGNEIASRRDRVTTHSERLLPMIAELLAAADLAPAGLDAIACGAGPGSFTGLRMGLSTAKGLCLATGRPLLMVSSLAALASRAPPDAVAVPCIDAYKGEVYAGFYVRDPGAPGGALVALEPEAALSPERLAAWLRARVAAGGRPVHLVGDGCARWPALALPGVVDLDRAPPDPVDVGRLAAVRRARGEADDLALAVPSYIRPSEAEIHRRPADPPADPVGSR